MRKELLDQFKRERGESRAGCNLVSQPDDDCRLFVQPFQVSPKKVIYQAVLVDAVSEESPLFCHRSSTLTKPDDSLTC